MVLDFVLDIFDGDGFLGIVFSNLAQMIIMLKKFGFWRES